MKKIILMALAGVLFVSCNDKKTWDPEENAKPPVYVSFARQDVEIVIANKNIALADAHVPMYSEMENGTQGIGTLKVWKVNVVDEETTAIEGVHYLLDQAASELGYRYMDIKFFPSEKSVVAKFTVLPRNITSEVKLTLKTHKEQQSASILSGQEIASRPNIEKTTITIKPAI